MKRLQVLFKQEDPNCEWEYVFCYNYQGLKGPIITTKDRSKALKEHDLGYFKTKFSNYHFRAT